MLRRASLIASIALVSGFAPLAPADTDPALFDQKLENRDDILIGELDNGLRYIIKQHQNPPNRLNMILHISSGSLTETGDFVGSPAYVSPEQASGRRVRVDERSDIYSLGVTLYELVTLHQPFAGKNVAVILKQILTRDPPPPSIFTPRLPSAPRESGMIASGPASPISPAPPRHMSGRK